MKKISLHRTLWLIIFLVILNVTNSYGQWIINESFESGVLPAGWVTYDVNNDGSRFRAFNKPTHAHSGNYICFVDCYDNDGNDWLVLPQTAIQAGDIFNFFARAWYGTEDMQVKLSTTGNAIANFNITLANISGIGSSYQEFNYDLSPWANQNVYLAIHWTQNTYGFIVDDVKVGQPLPNDVGTLNISSPPHFSLINSPVDPVATIKNFGTGEVTIDFPINCTITDQLNNVVYTGQRTYTETIAAGATDTVHFTAWTPTFAGDYNVHISTALTGDANNTNDAVDTDVEVVIHYGTGGPDAMSYQWIDSGEPDGPTYNWIEISNTGTSTISYGVPSFAGDDNFSEAIPIGFSFPFYGISRTFFHADVNGSLLLADNNWVKEYPDDGWDTDGNIFNYYTYIPGYSGMPALISVFWDDLVADEGTGDVYFQTFGTAPMRYTVIEWNNLRFAAGTGGSSTLCFEAILYENGEIIMQYKTVSNGQTGGANPHDFGQSATVGIQNDDFSTGLAYLNEHVESGTYIGPDPAGNLLNNEMAIRFYPGVDHQEPLISTGKVWNTFNNNATFTAIITDMSGLASDSLYFNYGSGWMAVTHDSITQLNHYHYSISDIPIGSIVEYKYVATDNSPYANRAVLDSTLNESLTFTVLPTAGTEILVMSPGNIPGYQDYLNTELPEYINALTNANVQFDIYNWAAYNQYDIPSQYNIIFAYSNSTGTSPIHDTLCLALIDFLDSGTTSSPKNLFFASDNLPSMQHGLPNDSYLNRFTTAYLRTGFEVQPNPPVYGGEDGLGGPDTPGFHSGSIIGVSNSPIGTLNLEIPVNADSPDVIYPRSCPSWYADDVTNPDRSSNISFKFQDGPVSGNAYSKDNPCAVWLDNLIYKSFFISFDISQLESDNDVQTMIDEALAWFIPETFTVTLEAVPGDGGTVTGAGNYVSGTTITVTATPGEIYEFINWTEDGSIVSTNPSYTFVVTSDRTLQANFQVASYTITAAAMPPEGGSVSGGGTYLYGTEVMLTASPAENYDFVNWTSGSNIISTEMEFGLLLLSDSSVVAHFVAQNINYEVALLADPVDGGTVTGAGSYVSGSQVTVIATAANNFRFDYWKENNEIVSSEEEYTFSIISDRSLTAHFTDVTSTADIVLSKVSVFPNPVSDRLTINNSGTGTETIRQIELFNTTGVLKRLQLESINNSYTLDLSCYPDGMVFIKVTLENGETGVFKIIHSK
ncbi:MAG: InlB B-repeat-containing protein [Omnitrophica WOR_2 bacterium]